MFDRLNPYSYGKVTKKCFDREVPREFNLKECFWFCMTSLTPQGGGECPKSEFDMFYFIYDSIDSELNIFAIFHIGISGTIVTATWWIFGLYS